MAILVTPAASIVDVAIPAEVLAGWYEVRLCAGSPDRVPLGSGFSVDAPHGLDALAEADTVIVPGGLDRPFDPPAAVIHALRDAAARDARIIATGSGASVLAAAGLLGEHSTTDGILTCPSGPAALDLCLRLVRQAKVVPHRPSGEVDELREVLDWATARLDQPLTLADMARAARTSPRTLTRRFHAALGTTPIQWLLAQRIRRAKHLLETTSEPVERIARLTGFASTGNFRQQFTRATGLSPKNYRRQVREPGLLVPASAEPGAPG